MGFTVGMMAVVIAIDAVLWFVLAHIFGWATALTTVVMFTAVEWLGYLFGIIVPLWGAKKQGLTIRRGGVYYWGLDTWYRLNRGNKQWQTDMESESCYSSLCYMGTVIWNCLHIALLEWVVLGLLYLVFVQFIWRWLCQRWVVWIFTKSWVRLLFASTQRMPTPAGVWLVLLILALAFVVDPSFRQHVVVVALGIFGLFALCVILYGVVSELSNWPWRDWWETAIDDLFSRHWYPNEESKSPASDRLYSQLVWLAIGLGILLVVVSPLVFWPIAVLRILLAIIGWISLAACITAFVSMFQEMHKWRGGVWSAKVGGLAGWVTLWWLSSVTAFWLFRWLADLPMRFIYGKDWPLTSASILTVILGVVIGFWVLASFYTVLRSFYLLLVWTGKQICDWLFIPWGRSSRQ